ncbi:MULTISPECIES: hypothetical protein [Kitasatospora]|uniref:Uncharacterized protein n=1 Tax=Kitasatospora cystarginea TaxID=58350 RepID=A0ABN3DLU5_9ACTN
MAQERYGLREEWAARRGRATAPSAAPCPVPRLGYTTPVATGSGNPYTPAGVCGSGLGVVDSHALPGAVVYLLFNGATGQNCVTTMATHPAGQVAMDATPAAQGGTPASNPGSFTYYAGPVTLAAPKVCVRWGGSYAGASWTSDWSHYD